MFGELFDDDNTTSTPSSQPTPSKGANCAASLPKPDPPRQPTNLVGLYNQGNTCYLNSSLQIMYLTLKFRNLINSLPLCINNSISTPSTFLPASKKYTILLSLQTLFAELNQLNLNAIKTTSLTNSFNWNSGENLDQHDSQEFFRLLLFETLEKILDNTTFTGVIDSLYKIGIVNKVKCTNCGNINYRFENEYVLPLQVYGVNSLEKAFDVTFNNEEVIEDYNCEKCKSKTNVIKSAKINVLPEYINIGLNRFTFDYNTFERIKITDTFAFPLEINLKKFCECDLYTNDNDYLYELYGVIIHSGSPYSGHYFAYGRDMSGQGKWEIIQEKENAVVKEDKVNETVTTTTNNNNNETSTTESECTCGGKKKKKCKACQNKQKSKKKGQKNKDNDNTNDDKANNYDNSDFPIEYTNKDLANNWYEFNDSVITPIKVGRLQKVFKSKTSAYMLFYIKKNISSTISLLPPPDYLLTYTQELNAKLTAERTHYEEEQQSLLISIYTENDIETIDNSSYYKMKPNTTPQTIKVKFTNKLNEITNITNNTLVLLVIYDIETHLITFIRKYTSMNHTNTLNELDIYHNSSLLIIHDVSSFNESGIKIGNEYHPIILKLYYDGTKLEHIAYLNETIPSLKQSLMSKYGIKDLNLSFQNASGQDVILDENKIYNKKTNEYKTIKDLNLHNKTLISITSTTKTESNNDSNINDVNCLIRTEDNEDDVKILKVNLNETFKDLVNKIKQLCVIDNEESFRIRIEINDKVITSNEMNNQLKTNPIFIEGDVRLKVEYGEIYNENEIAVNINMKNNANVTIVKEFIGDPTKVTVNLLKDVLIKYLNQHNKENNNDTPLNADDYTLFKVDYLGDPSKQIKDNNSTLQSLSIKDKETLWFKPKQEILSDTAYIEIYKCNTCNQYDINTEGFVPINIDNIYQQFTMSKLTVVTELKDTIRTNETDSKGFESNNNNIRLRLIGKFNQPERILKNEYTLKKYNVESPVRILYEITPEEEDIKDNELLIVLMLRDTSTKTYYNHKVVKFKYDNNTLGSDALYALCREYSKWSNITVAKHIRGMYMWEVIKEFDTKNKPLNLKKGQIIIRDSTWIGIRNDDDEKSSKDDFCTEYDNTMREIYNKRKKEMKNANKKTNRNKCSVEKSIRINIDD